MLHGAWLMMEDAGGDLRPQGDVFTGEFCCTVDGLGRFALPPVVRGAFPPDGDDASRSVVLLKSLEGCLWMYRTQDWEEKLRAMRQQLDDPQSRLLTHYLVAQSVSSSVDEERRHAIPPPLLEYAALKAVVVLIGLNDRPEFWSPSRWGDYFLRLEDQHTTRTPQHAAPGQGWTVRTISAALANKLLGFYPSS
jgi:MraZ protein